MVGLCHLLDDWTGTFGGHHLRSDHHEAAMRYIGSLVIAGFYGGAAALGAVLALAVLQRL